MAIYHLTMKNISRSQAGKGGSNGRSIVAAAAYRSGTVLWDTRAGRTWIYTAKANEVVHQEITIPDAAQSRDAWQMMNRQHLWNAVETAEKRKDARLAKEVEIAIPKELQRDAQIACVRDFAKHFTDQGLIVDWAIHDKGDGNPHAHMLIPTRELTSEGFGKKNRWLDGSPTKDGGAPGTQFVDGARLAWEDVANRHLKASHVDERIDRRTLVEQGIDREPTIKIGATAKAMAERAAQQPGDKTPSELMDEWLRDQRRTARLTKRSERRMTAQKWDEARKHVAQSLFSPEEKRPTRKRATERKPVVFKSTPKRRNRRPGAKTRTPWLRDYRTTDKGRTRAEAARVRREQQLERVRETGKKQRNRFQKMYVLPAGAENSFERYAFAKGMRAAWHRLMDQPEKFGMLTAEYREAMREMRAARSFGGRDR